MARPRDLCFIDCETTGLDPNRHEIVEVAALRTTADGATITGEYVARVMPQRLDDASPEALRVNGFDREVWARTAVPIADALSGVGQVADGAAHAGHNPSFDARFLRAEAHRARRSGAVAFVDYHPIDTASMAVPLLVSGRLSSLGLDAVTELLGFPRPAGAHGAREDADLSRRVFVALSQAFGAVALGVAPRRAPADDGLNAEVPQDVVEFIGEIEAALHDLDEVPEAGADFAESVREKLEGIRDTVEETLRVTEGQRGAVENMAAGIARWLR